MYERKKENAYLNGNFLEARAPKFYLLDLGPDYFFFWGLPRMEDLGLVGVPVKTPAGSNQASPARRASAVLPGVSESEILSTSDLLQDPEYVVV